MRYHLSLTRIQLYSIIFIFSIASAIYIYSDEPKKILKFGHATGENPAIIFEKYAPLVTYLSKKLNRKIIFIQKKTYKKTQKAFLDGQIDMGILNAFSYIKVSHSSKIIPIAARVKRNSRTYQTYIIVRKSSSIYTYNDLKGKIFAFGDPFSTSSNLMPRILLKRHGINPTVFFKKVYIIKKQDSPPPPPPNRTIDAGAMASFIFNEQNPDVTQMLRIIDKSPKFPLGPFVVRKALGQKLINRIRYILLNMDKSEEGLKALHHAELDRFEVVSDNDYNIVRQMYKNEKGKK